MDDFDDDLTTMSHQRDDFDDDETTMSHQRDDFDDDETNLVGMARADHESTYDELVGGTIRAPALKQLELAPRQPLQLRGSQAVPNAAHESHISLRDRVPDARPAWQPPTRPRSPEYVAPPVRRRRPWRNAAMLLLLTVLLVLVAWYAFVRDGDSAGLDEDPDTSDNVGVVDGS